MLSKRTIIGLIGGIAIITIGGASLIQHLGLHTDDDFYDVIEAPQIVIIAIPPISPMIVLFDNMIQ
jgi:hypothetical protein